MWMKPLRSTPYGYKEFCRCLSDVPWKGAYAAANARRDIERARFGYGRKDWRSEPYTMTKQFPWSQTAAGTAPACSCRMGIPGLPGVGGALRLGLETDAELSEDEIRDKLELNDCFYQPISERELFYTARGNGKSYRYTNLASAWP